MHSPDMASLVHPVDSEPGVSKERGLTAQGVAVQVAGVVVDDHLGSYMEQGIHQPLIGIAEAENAGNKHAINKYHLS
jgi:hypothetical protein